jgi:predicted O-linked N-acetylglucosamine transferase (SPINDLY family)
MAVGLACNAERRSALKQKLAEHRLRKPLFDSRSFTQHLEAAYTSIYERYQAGLAPAHIEVPQG